MTKKTNNFNIILNIRLVISMDINIFKFSTLDYSIFKLKIKKIASKEY